MKVSIYAPDISAKTMLQIGALKITLYGVHHRIEATLEPMLKALDCSISRISGHTALSFRCVVNADSISCVNLKQILPWFMPLLHAARRVHTGVNGEAMFYGESRSLSPLPRDGIAVSEDKPEETVLGGGTNSNTKDDESEKSRMFPNWAFHPCSIRKGEIRAWGRCPFRQGRGQRTR